MVNSKFYSRPSDLISGDRLPCNGTIALSGKIAHVLFRINQHRTSKTMQRLHLVATFCSLS